MNTLNGRNAAVSNGPGEREGIEKKRREISAVDDVCAVLDVAFVLAPGPHRSRKVRLTLLKIPLPLLMGEDERPPGPFNDMLGVVETRGVPRGPTKAVHDDDASTTRAAGRAEKRTILDREDERKCR